MRGPSGRGGRTPGPHLAHRGTLGRIARHGEVISPIGPIGAALALVREQVERVIPGAGHEQLLALRVEAEAAVIDHGAAADGVMVTVDPQPSTVRAVSAELPTHDRAHRADEEERLRTTAAGLRTEPGQVR